MRKITLLTIASIFAVGLPISVLAANHNQAHQANMSDDNTSSQCSCKGRQADDNKFKNGKGSHRMAQRGEDMMSMRGLYRDLNLTDAQKQSMHDIMKQQKESMQQSHDTHRGMHNATMSNLYPLIATDKFDEAAVRKEIEANNKANVDRQIEMAKSANKMYNILTPEQKTLLAQKHQAQVDAMNKAKEQ